MRWSLVAAVNNEHVLQTSLLSSPDVSSAADRHLMRDYPSAGAAYNDAIPECTGDVIIFAHQDVYLPPGWIEAVYREIEKVQGIDRNWGVLGVCGANTAGRLVGHLYSTGIRGVFGQALDRPVAAVSLDEMVIVLRRASGLRFDPALPGFHLYGADICLEARRLGLSSFVISAFCVHNSNGINRLPLSFWRAYWRLRTKWQAELPVVTTCTSIYPDVARAGGEVLRGFAGGLFSRSTPGNRVEDPAALFRRLAIGDPS